MLIHVTKIGDLAFEVRLDEALRRDLQDVSGWRTEEEALRQIVAGVLLPAHYLDDPGDGVPF